MGWGGGFGGKGWGGNSWSPWQPMFSKGKGKGKKGGLKVDPALKVWLGNIPVGSDWKALQTHMNQAGTTKWVEVFDGKGSGTGAVAYSTSAEAANAVAMLNGSVFNGANIQVDVWVRKPKEGM
eukprot:TRINITY_DN41885_c0_g1_i1.p1 TRINITY_DN41885_c0_g1~~TRINITY_DN41885_c0_g1_i1.p1  ORF type:complete len:123 (+),score=34.33 TRINITY_DN41885_c0_g1_i1:91-459(+)